MKTSDQTSELAKAMAQAQGEMSPAEKDSENPFFKSKFSSFSSVWGAIRIPLQKNQLTVWQDVTASESNISVTTRITHSSGQWVEFGPLTMMLMKKDPQGIGSLISYAKRYALCSALGVVSDETDDDGESAMNRNQVKHETVNHTVNSVKITEKLSEIPSQNTISEPQAKELSEKLRKCSDKFKEETYAFLYQKRIGEDLKGLPEALYERLSKKVSDELKVIGF